MRVRGPYTLKESWEISTYCNVWIFLGSYLNNFKTQFKKRFVKHKDWILVHDIKDDDFLKYENYILVLDLNIQF